MMKLILVSSIETNWININQLEGFGRIYAILVLGDNSSMSHTLNVNLYYDFEDTPRERLKITPSSLNGTVFGSDATYGLSSPFGGSFNGTYQFVVRPKVQKCSSIRIELSDSFPDGSTSASFKFSGLSLVVGIKEGWNKGLSYTRRLT